MGTAATPAAEDGAEGDHHLPEKMVAVKVWVQGELEKHTVIFSHTCGIETIEVQRELPW